LIDVILLIAVIFGAGFLAAVISRTTDLPIIPFLILAGVASSFFIQFESSETILAGILFLVFYIGLRTDFGGFREIASDSINIAVVQVSVLSFLGFVMGQLFGFGTVDSLYLGLAAGLGSTLAGTDLFDQKMRMDLHHGKISTGANLTEDFLAVVFIGFITAQSIGGGFLPVFLTVFLLFSALVFRYLFSPRIQPLFETVELQVLLVVSAFSLSASIGYYTDISVVATCFAGGLALSGGVKTDEILDSVEHVKDFFAVITFVGLGSLVSISSVTTIYVSLGLLALVLIIRPIVVFLIALIDDNSPLTGFKISLNLSEVSEFALAAVFLAVYSGSISDTIFESVVISMAFSMVFVGFLAHRQNSVFEKIAGPIRRLEYEFLESYKQTSLQNHVILAGYDKLGSLVAEELRRKDEEFLVIDYNRSNIEKAGYKNYNTFFADLTDNKVWEKANYDKSDLIILTTTNPLVLEQLKKLEQNSIVVVDSEEQFNDLKEYEAIKPLLKTDATSEKLSKLLKEEFG